MVQERRVSGGSSIIPQAEGAEIDSAALTPQSAPFLASADTGVSARLAENMDVLYGEGALRDPGLVSKTKTAALQVAIKKVPSTGTIYQTISGDTLSSIATAFGLPIDTIVEFNPSVNFSSLTTNTPIVIPGKDDLAI